MVTSGWGLVFKFVPALMSLVANRCYQSGLMNMLISYVFLFFHLFIGWAEKGLTPVLFTGSFICGLNGKLTFFWKNYGGISGHCA